MNAFPFDSRIITHDEDGLPVYDRASDAAEFAAMLHSFFVNGIFGSEMCEVLQSGGMDVTIGVGKMLIEGRFGNIKTPETVTFDASEGLPRIDTVVLRLDLSSNVNYIVTGIRKGTASSTPVAPSLTRDGTVWELGIADVLIPANSTAVSQQNITDTRLNDARCGLVAAVLADIDTTHLYEQIQAELAYFKDVEEQGVRDWLETIQGLLEGDVAANLAAQITKKTSSGVQTVTLLAADWLETSDESIIQTVSVEGVTENENRIHIIPSPVASQYTAYTDAGIRAVAQGAGTVTFTADSVPESDITVNVLIIDSGVSA